MGTAGSRSQQEWRVENVAVGETTSRLSSVIFFLLCGVPVFSTILFGGVDNATWIFISIFWAAIILSWLVEASRAGGLIFNSSILQLPIAGLIVIGLVQLLPLGSGVSGDLLSIPYSHSLSLDPYATRFFLSHLAVYFVFFAACLVFINSESRIRKVVLLVIIFGAFMAFLGILQWLADPGTIYGLREPSGAVPFGAFVNEHHFAAFMEMPGGLALALILGKKTGNDKKPLLIIALVIMVVALILTSSRGGMLSLISVSSFVLLLTFLSQKQEDKNKADADKLSGIQRIGLVAGGVALVILIIGVVIFLGGDESLFRGIGMGVPVEDVSNGRTHFWSVAIKIFLEHPFLGAGLDAFGVAFTKHDTWNGIYRVEQAHNEYLQMLAETGLVGFACVAAFIYFLFKKGLAIISGTGNSFRQSTAIGSLAGCLGILVHSFFDFPLRTPSNAFFFLLLAAIATVSVKTTGDDEVPRRKRRSSAP